MTKGEILEFQNGPTAEVADHNRNDRTQELDLGDDTTAVHLKTLDFSTLSEFW